MKSLTKTRQLDKTEKHAIISDLHGPYLDRKAFAVVLGILTEHPWHTLWINGDLADFAQISSHDSKISYIDHSFDELITLEEELFLIQAEILKPLRKAVGPKARIVYRLGNHDRRLMSMSEKNPTALAEMLKTILRHRSPYIEDLLQLDRYGVQISHKPIDMVHDKFSIVHGVRCGQNAAKFNLQRYGSGTSGHTHKAGEAQMILGGKLASWTESGCLRTLEAEYRPFGDKVDWCQAMLELIINPNRPEWFCNSYKIINHRTYFHGELFAS